MLKPNLLISDKFGWLIPSTMSSEAKFSSDIEIIHLLEWNVFFNFSFVPIFVAACALGVSQLVKMFWFLSLCSDLFILVLSLFAFSALTSAFQFFSRKLCLHISGLRMRNFAINRFPIKNSLINSLLTPIVENIYFNTDMCKFEFSQKDESRVESADSSKWYRKSRAFKFFFQILPKP